jgi:tetratricopeptide (TPR) repeat protein
MATCSEKELPDKSRALWLKARSAAELKNYGYAISLLQNVLKEVPTFLDGRKMLRSAAIAQANGKKGSGLLSSLSSVSLRGAGNVKKDPLAAMDQAERMLDSDPFNIGANTMLKEAAMAAGMVETAIFALETLVKGNPEDTKVLHELGELYLSNEKTELALEVFNKIAEINPSDLQALKRAKDGSGSTNAQAGGLGNREKLPRPDQGQGRGQGARTKGALFQRCRDYRRAVGGTESKIRRESAARRCGTEYRTADGAQV